MAKQQRSVPCGMMVAMFSAAGALTVIELLTGGAVLGFVIALIWRWPGLGFLMIGGVLVVAWEQPTLPPLAQVAGASIYPEDTLAVAFLVVAAIRWGNASKTQQAQLLAFIVFVFVIALSLVRGVTTHGLNAAINEARSILWVVAAAAWTLTQASDSQLPRRIHRFIVSTGFGITVAAFVHMLQRGLGNATELLLVDGQYFTARPLVSTQALFLALAGTYLLQRRRLGELGALFLVLVVLVQHRSVWVAAICGGAVLAMRSSGLVRRRLVAGVLLLFGTLTSLVASGFAPTVTEQIGASAADRATFDDRLFGWGTFLLRYAESGFFNLIFGIPFGTGWTRVNANGVLVEVSPHNWYVMLLVRLGALGFLSLLAGLWATARRLVRDGNTSGQVWLAILLVYCLAYNLEWTIAPFLALTMLSYQQTDSTSEGQVNPRAEPRNNGPSDIYR